MRELGGVLLLMALIALMMIATIWLFRDVIMARLFTKRGKR